MRKRYITENEHMYLIMPFSEACMHMRIAGKRMNAEVRKDSVQLLDENDRNFSFPITLGEAGVFSDKDGNYIYEPEEDYETKCIHHVPEGEICRTCASIVNSRYVVRDKEGDLAAFDTKEIATYWIEQRDSADYLRIYDKQAKEYVS